MASDARDKMQVHPAISWLRLIEPAQEKMAYGVLSGLTPRSGFYGCHDMYNVGYSSLCYCKARFLGRYIASVLQGRASNVSPRLWNAALADLLSISSELLLLFSDLTLYV